MNSVRIKMLEQFIADNPADPFNHYALALEFMKTDVDQASKIFDQLLLEHPNYLPTYYQAALVAIKLSQLEKASKIIHDGITLARKVPDPKTVTELSSLMDALE